MRAQMHDEEIWGIKLKVKPHARFQRKGPHLFMARAVTLA